MLGFAGSAPTYRLCRLWLSVAKPNVYRVISFPPPHPQPQPFNKREKGAMPLPLSHYASPIGPAWLAIIFPMLLYPLSLWERARVRGNKRSEWHRSCISAKRCNARRLLPPASPFGEPVSNSLNRELNPVNEVQLNHTYWHSESVTGGRQTGKRWCGGVLADRFFAICQGSASRQYGDSPQWRGAEE